MSLSDERLRWLSQYGHAEMRLVASEFLALRASQAKVVEAAAQICERRAARHAADRKRIEATPGHDQAIINACIAAEDEANETAVDIRALAEHGGQT